MQKNNLFNSINESFDRKYMSSQKLNESLESQVAHLLAKKGLDISVDGADNLIDAAAEYIQMTRDSGEDYSVEEWFEDTLMNYPEEIDFMNTKNVKFINNRKNSIIRGDDDPGYDEYDLEESKSIRLKDKDKWVFIRAIERAKDKEELEDIIFDLIPYEKHLFNLLRSLSNSSDSLEDLRQKMIKTIKKSMEYKDESLKEDLSEFQDKLLKDFLKTIDHRSRVNVESISGYDQVGGPGNTSGINGLAHDVGWYLADKKIKSIVPKEDLPKDAQRFYDYKIVIE